MRNIVALLSLSLVVATFIWFYAHTHQPQVPVVPEKPALAPELYPLFPATSTWSSPRFETVFIGTTTYSGTSVETLIATSTKKPSRYFAPFEQYYDKVLKTEGWAVASDLAAGGHVGGQSGYRKGDRVILTRFHIDYQTISSTSPSECPCDVTLSLFSTKAR